MEEIKLGDNVACKITGFGGIVTGICHYLHGETRYEVTSSHLTDGGIKTEWFYKDSLYPPSATV